MRNVIVPHSLSANRIKDYKGVPELLIQLGTIYIQRAHFKDIAPDSCPTIEHDLPELTNQILELEKSIEGFFLLNPGDPILSYCTITSEEGEKDKLDIRQVRIHAYLIARLIHGKASVPVYEIARAVTIDDSAAGILENRRIIVTMAIEDRVRLVGDCSEIDPKVQLGIRMTRLLFGQFGMPFVTEGVLERIREVRAENARHSKQANKEHADDEENENTTATRDRHRRNSDSKANHIKRDTSLTEFVESLPVLTPKQMFDALTTHGIVGQESARRQLCLAMHRHISRLRKIHLEHIPPNSLPATPRYLVRGDTGVGKSFCCSVLAGISNIPHALIDITLFSETGFVGEDITQIPTRLLVSANMNLEIAQACGLIILDEIDKISNGSSNGQKYVSRDGVQRSLLVMLGGCVMDIPTEVGWKGNRCSRVRFDTSGVMFLGLGAFSDWGNRNGKPVPPIGFNEHARNAPHNTSHSAESYAKYGLMNEVIGRFTGGVIQFDPLSKQDMLDILNRNVISKYADELAMDGIALIVEPEVTELIIKEAMDLGTGARGLQPALLGVIQEACFTVYSHPSEDRCIRLYVDHGAVNWASSRASSKALSESITEARDGLCGHFKGAELEPAGVFS